MTGEPPTLVLPCPGATFIFPTMMAAVPIPWYPCLVLEVVCAIIIRDHEILLCQRPPGKHLAGFWEFPGGKVEEGEDHATALQREIGEELSCELEVGKPFPAIEHHYPTLSLRLQGFPCSLSSSSPEPHAVEHSSLSWTCCEKVEALQLAEADQRLRGRVQATIKILCQGNPAQERK